MYSVFVVERVFCIDFDVGSEVEGVCETWQAAERFIKTLKDEYFKRTGRSWNDEFYHQGKLRIREHYLHVKGLRP